MRFRIFILLAVLAGCTATNPTKESGFSSEPASSKYKAEKTERDFDFDAASLGKRKFVVGGPIGKDGNNKLYDFCDSFDQSICSRRLDKYTGKKGFIVESEPFISDRFYFGYHVVLEDGEELVLKLSNVYKDKDPIEAALHLISAESFEKAKALQGASLIEGLSVTVTGQSFSGGLISILLSNGEKISQNELNKRIQFINENIPVAERNMVFSEMKNINLKYDDFEERWWVKPKSFSDMPVYSYFGKKGSDKWIRFVANFEGYDWVFFDRISIVSNSQRYDKSFSHYDVKRDNGSGKVWEWIDIPATEKEESILEALSSHQGKIRFSGKYESTKDISKEQSMELKSIHAVYKAVQP